MPNYCFTRSTTSTLLLVIIWIVTSVSVDSFLLVTSTSSITSRYYCNQLRTTSTTIIRPMVQASWNGKVIADSDETVVVEGNHYFPPESIKREFFTPSSTTTTCPWKGVASYYSLNVDGKENKDAAWYYVTPKDAAKQIAGRVAFWKGVKVA